MVSRDEGVTLIELLVALALLLVGLALFSSVYFVTQNASKRQFEIGDTGNQVRLAFLTMERQVRSGYVAKINAVGGGSYASATIYSEADGTRKCAGWALDQPLVGTQSLYAATWGIGGSAPSFPAGWTRMATGIRNRSLSVSAADTFSAKWFAPGVGSALGVHLYVNTRTAAAPGIPDEPTRYDSTFAARNIRRSTMTVPGPGTLISTLC